jgi:hypothetical protein
LREDEIGLVSGMTTIQAETALAPASEEPNNVRLTTIR